MCGCSSSFDGDFDEIESNKTFSFVSDIETDNDFDDFLTKKMRDRAKKRKELRDSGYSRKEARKIVKGKMMEKGSDSSSPAKAKPKNLSDGSIVSSDDNSTNTSIGMSNTKKALIGVGIVGVIGLGIYFIRRKK